MSTNSDLINEFNDRLTVLKKQYYDHGVLRKEVRSYEVSLWTLQDEFLTVLKWSDVEQKGRIESPMLTINVDGTQKLTFSIPMQYVLQGVTYDNPNWYTVETGQLIMGLRKVKVIFNKGEEYEVTNEEEQARLRSSNVFELVITKVTEEHADDQARCNVECEGLAFHELGKIGYKLNLSQANFELDREEWDKCAENPRYWMRYDNTKCYTEPNETVQYWCEEGCKLPPRPADRGDMSATQWYYDIQMNWGSFSDMPHRAPDKIYEEEYVSSWSDDLKPQTIETFREKARPVEVSESNLYNITQTIAETFGIYCRYEYGYDENYHIISRQIIFYNNYFDETNIISFTYPYLANKISREMDCTDVTTKMFVRPQDSDVVASGKITIADCPANRTKEDYLLNFDYMRTCGAINEEQYNYIPVFEKEVRRLNTELEKLSLQIQAQEEEKIEAEAIANVAKNSIALDQESIDYNTELYKRLDASDGTPDGYFARVAAHPYQTYIKKDDKQQKYIDLSTEDKGLIPDTLYIFRYFQSSKQTFKVRIPKSKYTIKNDKYGHPERLLLSGVNDSWTTDSTTFSLNTDPSWGISSTTDSSFTPTTSNSSIVYLVYKYKPQLYYDAVNQVWLQKQAQDETKYNDAKTRVDDATEALEDLYAQYNQKLADKELLISKFERMMGPALREGYWQPEDVDYGDKKVESFALPHNYDAEVMINDAHNEEEYTYAAVGWDGQLFDEEDKNYYEESVLQNKVYYPCIEITSSLMSHIASWYTQGKTISFIFNNNYYKDLTAAEKKLVQNCTVFALGSQMQFGFIVKEEQYNDPAIVPVLILTGAQSMTDEQISFMQDQNKGNPRVGVINSKIVEGAEVTDAPTAEWVFDGAAINVGQNFITELSKYCIVYPRIKISSTELNTSSIILKYNNVVLQNYSDYLVLSRTVVRDDETGSPSAHFEYFITIKPHVLFEQGSLFYNFNIAYTLSNASTCVYLDAQKVMQDSSKPRASYTVEVNALDGKYLKTLYRNLTQIIMINDTKLKFENVFGYISQLDLNLDAPWEDKIEVKNYKTKFEDLFTTIVASSENMRQNEAALDAVTAGRIPLNEDAVIKMVINNSSLLQEYLDNGIEASLYVKAMLADVFTEAGAILADSHSALNNVKDLTLRNAEVLSGFIQNISAEMTPRVINSINQPTDFKVGDIWNELDAQGNVVARHLAMSSSEDSSSGFVRTFDGTLASLRGASLNMDAVAGTVEILAQNQIDMKSGGNIYIAANDKVDIVGNREVNIGGTTINIGSATSSDSDQVGGINLVATRYDNITNADTSLDNTGTGELTKVLIHPDKIEMGGSNIIMRGSNSIQMITSRNSLNSTSALSISPEDGVWIGSGAGIRLYSGNVNLTSNGDGTFSIVNGTGSNVELLPQHLLMGVSNTENESGTAIKMTDEYIILAAGGKLHHDVWKKDHIYSSGTVVTVNSILYKCLQSHMSDNFITELENDYWEVYDADADLEVTGTIGGLVGAKFTASSIGFATKDSVTNNINAILMNDKGITLGSGNFNLDVDTAILRAYGSAVRIAPRGIDIGSSGYLYINTTNFKLNSNATGTTPTLGIYSSNGTVKDLVYTPQDGLYIHGNIVNDKMAFITSNDYEIAPQQTYNPGIYVTDTNIQETGAAIERLEGEEMVSYYEWHNNGKTYYCTKNSGNSFTVTNEKVLTYKSNVYAVAPKYAPKPQTKNYNNLYTYIVYYITTDNNGTLLTVNGNSIQYDGSSDPQIANTWYQKIPENQRSAYAIEYRSETNELIDVSENMIGKTLERNLDVTFSVIASSGLTTIKTGQLGNFFVGPSGLTSGSIANGVISNTQLNSCLIENQYNTGYYGRCFYDYSFNRDKGILTLKRIDGKSEKIDIATAIKVILEGGQTNDSNVPTNGSGSGGTSSCSDCTATCASDCTGECTGSCSGQCVTTCSGGCKGSCKDGCKDGCKGGCKNTCSDACTETCANSCERSCRDGCDTTCTTACDLGCASNCTVNCGNSCSKGCAVGCSGGNGILPQ